jgi:hypothetical protein
VVMLKGEDLGEYFLTKLGVLEKGQVKSTRNQRVCMKNLMTVEEAKSVSKNRSKWKEVISAYPMGNGRDVMIVWYTF